MELVLFIVNQAEGTKSFAEDMYLDRLEGHRKGVLGVGVGASY